MFQGSTLAIGHLVAEAPPWHVLMIDFGNFGYVALVRGFTSKCAVMMFPVK